MIKKEVNLMSKEAIIPSEVDLTDSNIQQCPYSAYKTLRN